MTTFTILNAVPFGEFALPAVGAVMGWFMIALLAFTTAGLLPMILAAVYGRPVDEVGSEHAVDDAEVVVDFEHREAA